MNRDLGFLTFVLLFFSCSGTGDGNGNSLSNDHKTIKIAFLDAFQDVTIEQAKQGFINALKDQGFDEKNHTLEIIYKNAQGSIPTMSQEISYFLSQNVRLIATNTTLSTISTAQRTHSVPIFMMVSPSPTMAGLLDKEGKAPKNLFGVYENLDYIDTSILLLRQIKPKAHSIGAIFSQSEAQSNQAYEHLRTKTKDLGFTLFALPVNNSSETQLVVQNLLSHHLDAFFALPDNSVFSSFETILKSCNQAKVPIFTSEQGLVKRGALAAFGPDIYQWGYQSGMEAAKYLKTGKLDGIKPEIVKIRNRVYNPTVARQFNIFIPSGISPIRP